MGGEKSVMQVLAFQLLSSFDQVFNCLEDFSLNLYCDHRYFHSVLLLMIKISLCIQVGREAEDEAEGEAERYFHHAITLRNTLLFLRYNKELFQDDETTSPMGLGKLWLSQAVAK